MTLHRIIVVSMFVVTTVSALLYVSTFPAVGEGRLRAAPMLMLETERPSALPASESDGRKGRGIGAEALKHLA